MIPVDAIVATAALLGAVALKGSIVLACAAAAAWICRRGAASLRHAIWAAAVTAQLALLAGALTLPAWELPLPQLPSVRVSLGVGRWAVGEGASGVGRAASGATALAGEPFSPDARRRAPDLPGTTAPASLAEPLPAALASSVVPSYGVSEVAQQAVAPDAGRPTPDELLALLWALGAALVLLRLLLGTVRVATLARRGERVEDGAWLSLAQRTANRLHITRPLTILRGDRLEVPVTWGVVYPVVLLPAEADRWPAERRRVVLLHEMAHVKRLDALTQLLAQLCAALFWFSPLVWMAVRRMRVEREHACDDYVLRDGIVPSRYADELLGIVRSLGTLRRDGAAPAFAALAMARRSEFEGRMLAILDPRAERRTLGHRGTMALAALAALLVLPLAALRPATASAHIVVTDPTSGVGRAASGAPAPRARRATTPRILVVPEGPSGVGRRASGEKGAPALAVAPDAARPTPDGFQDRTIYRCTAADLETSNDMRLVHTDDDGDGQGLTEYSVKHRGYCLHAALLGPVDFTEDLRDVQRIVLPNGRAYFHEITRGYERELTVDRQADGSLRHVYTERGRPAAFDEGAREWLASIIQSIVRESGVNAERRVAQLRARGGVDAVLREVAEISSDGAKRKYFTALLAATPALTTAEADRVVRQAGRDISSDGDLRAVLQAAMSSRSGVSTGAIGEALGRISSDGDRRAVIARALTASTDVRVYEGLLRSTREISSDGDKSALLVQAAPRGAVDPRLRPAYFDAANTISSDGDRRRVLLAALGAVPQDSCDVIDAVIRSATAISSDGDKADVLLAAARKAPKLIRENIPIRQAFMRAAKSISSDGDYRRVVNEIVQ